MVVVSWKTVKNTYYSHIIPSSHQATQQCFAGCTTWASNSHEHEDQKRHRSKFTKKYLTQLEPRSHRWVQMSTDQAEIIRLSLPANDPLLCTGHSYVDPDTGVDHVEFHVDDHDCMQDFANTTYGALGGNVSVRKTADQKPLIIFVAFHSNAIGGHLNAYRTLHRIRLRYYWPGCTLISSACAMPVQVALWQTLPKASHLNSCTTSPSRRSSPFHRCLFCGEAF